LNRFSLDKKKYAIWVGKQIPDSAETFQEVLLFLQKLASKVTIQHTKIRCAARFVGGSAFLQICFEIHRSVSATSAKAENLLKGDFDFSWDE